jgi:hypothetical protein
MLICRSHTLKGVSNGAEVMKIMGEYDRLLSYIRLLGIDGVSLADCLIWTSPSFL